jgi:hypothetical protein
VIVTTLRPTVSPGELLVLASVAMGAAAAVVVTVLTAAALVIAGVVGWYRNQVPPGERVRVPRRRSPTWAIPGPRAGDGLVRVVLALTSPSGRTASSHEPVLRGRRRPGEYAGANTG